MRYDSCSASCAAAIIVNKIVIRTKNKLKKDKIQVDGISFPLRDRTKMKDFRIKMRWKPPKLKNLG